MFGLFFMVRKPLKDAMRQAIYRLTYKFGAFLTSISHSPLRPTLDTSLVFPISALPRWTHTPLSSVVSFLCDNGRPLLIFCFCLGLIELCFQVRNVVTSLADKTSMGMYSYYSMAGMPNLQIIQYLI
jgi:hypothetical protein